MRSKTLRIQVSIPSASTSTFIKPSALMMLLYPTHCPYTGDPAGADVILVRQRPGTASSTCFITIEDETATANLVVFQKLFQQYRKEILQLRLLMVEGKVQIEGEVIHIIVQHCHNMSPLLQQMTGVQDVSEVQTVLKADEDGEHYQSKDARVKAKAV